MEAGAGFVADPSASAEENEAARQAFEQSRAALVGALAGYVTSGGNAVNVSQGSSIARGAVTWNRQLHIKEAELIELYAADYAVEQGYCESTDTCPEDMLALSRAELTAETLRGVSDDYSIASTNGRAREFLNSLAEAGTQVDGQTMFGQLDRNSVEYKNSLINIGDFGQTSALYAEISTALIAFIGADALKGNALIGATDGVATDIRRYFETTSKEDFRAFVQAASLQAEFMVAMGNQIEAARRAGQLDDTSVVIQHDLASAFRQVGEYMQGDLSASVWTAAEPGVGQVITEADYTSPIGPDGQPNALYFAHEKGWQSWGEALAIAGMGLTLSPRAGVAAGPPELPSGYHYRNVDGDYIVVRNPGQAGSLPQLHLENGQLLLGPKPSIARNIATRSAFLRSLANNGNVPSNLRIWLEQGKVPPGFVVHHRTALYDGGTDTVNNMVLQSIDLHTITHRFYRPGGTIPSISPPPPSPY